MPPSAPTMSVFQRGGNFLQSRLSRLYSDTKQSYEEAVVTGATSTPSDYSDPDVESLRIEFQTQQDRLLAWGLDWADTNAAQVQKDGDIEIDKKLDKAGVGDVVADVLSEIQRLLSQAGDIQRPTKKFRSETKMRELAAFANAEHLEKRWTWHEISRFRSLLEQLTTCLDVLYKLSDSKRTSSQSSKLDKENVRPRDAAPSIEKSPKPGGTSHRSSYAAVQEAAETPHPSFGRVPDVQPESIQQESHGIDYASLRFAQNQHPSDSGLPLYEEAMAHERSRVIATLVNEQQGEPLAAYFCNSHIFVSPHHDNTCSILLPFFCIICFWFSCRGLLLILSLDATPVIVEFVSIAHDTDWAGIVAGNLHNIWDLFANLLPDIPISHTGHARLLGHTIDHTNARVGYVYLLPPDLKAETVSTNPKALSSLLSAHMESSDSSPNLEDRIRLAYNIIIALLGLILEGQSSHGNLDSSNIVLFQHQQKITAQIRHPYLFSHTKLFPPSSHFKDLLSTSIYRHPNDVTDGGVRLAAYEIYSLGLVLLEIGLWLPLSRFWKPKYNTATFRNRIRNQYVPKLASKCGSAYMQVVQKCLGAPEDLVPNAADMDIEDQEQRRLAVEFMLGLAKDMARCCAIDVDGESTKEDLDYFQLRFGEQQKSADTEGQSMLDAPMTPRSLPDEDLVRSATKRATPTSMKSESQQATVAVLRRWTDVDIPQTDLDEWNTKLMHRIGRLLEKALTGSPRSCSLSLMMVGETREKAKTTICIECEDVARVRKALQAGFKTRRGWGVVVLKGKIRRSGKKRRTMAKTTAHMQPLTRQSSYQEKPTCGASIGAFKDDQHLPPVSFGGTILVDGRPFGMTVHHMLDAPSEDESDEDVAERCAAPRAQVSEDLQFMRTDEHISDHLAELEISDDDEASDTSTIRPDYAAFDEEGNEFWFIDDSPPRPDNQDTSARGHMHAGRSPATPELDLDEGSDSEDSSSDDDDDVDSVGDTVGVDPYDEDEVLVTQPAIDDVEEDFFPSSEDKDEDHLASHSLGYVHASSGIRRRMLRGVKHEIDWALIKVHEERLQVGNSIRREIAASRSGKMKHKNKKQRRRAPSQIHDHSRQDQMTEANSTRGDRREHEPLPLAGVAPLEQLAGSEVYCCGRTSGFQKGRISKAMTYVKMHGRESFSSSWFVEGGFGGMLHPGGPCSLSFSVFLFALGSLT
jgi:hypothetical protein